jgi:hypothetical protein
MELDRLVLGLYSMDSRSLLATSHHLYAPTRIYGYGRTVYGRLCDHFSRRRYGTVPVYTETVNRKVRIRWGALGVQSLRVRFLRDQVEEIACEVLNTNSRLKPLYINRTIMSLVIPEEPLHLLDAPLGGWSSRAPRPATPAPKNGA